MPFLAIATITSLAILALSYLASIPTYRVAPAFLLPVLWAVLAFRRKLHLHPLHYALFAVAMLLHMLGGLGYYRASPLPFSYDILLHFYFPMAIALILHRFLRHAYPLLRPWQAATLTFSMMMCLGALHEIMEYGTYLTLGEEKGMLKPKTSYFFDTQRDLTNNLLGTLTALALSTLPTRRPRDLSSSPTPPGSTGVPPVLTPPAHQHSR
jgi:uncharacterized membrane protein YjdF